MSYLISSLTMGPGEVMIFSPDATRRGSNANELHDELFPGMNYNARRLVLKLILSSGSQLVAGNKAPSNIGLKINRLSAATP